MLKLTRWVTLGLMGAALQAGCRDNTPPVQRTPVPGPGQETFYREHEPQKPLPPQAIEGPITPMPFEDEPLLIDTPAEAKRFVEVYQKVNRPRLVVFVNRTLEGQLIPSSGGDQGPYRTVERTRKSTTGVTVETKEYRNTVNRRGETVRDSSDKVKLDGPGEYTERTEEYLRPGEYDEISAKAIDYGMMETLLTDWMSADNQVNIVSPLLSRKKLMAEQLKSIQEGDAQSMQALAEQLDADVLIQVQARITRQTPQGPAVRILAEAMNTRGGESLARAAVDMDPPLDKPQLNRYTRFLARKLMDGMTTTWTSAGPARQGAAGAAGQTTAPSGQKGLGPRLEPER